MQNHQMGSQMKGRAPSSDDHRMPAASAQEPAGERRGACHGERLAEVPIGIGARPFVARKPTGQQDQRGRKHPALGHSEEEAHHLELPETPRHPAAHRAQPPENQAQADHLARAPARGPIASRNLQQDVAQKKNARRLPLHPIVHRQVLHHGLKSRVQRQGNVGAIHVRNGVHDQRDRNNPHPALLIHIGAAAPEFCTSLVRARRSISHLRLARGFLFLRGEATFSFRRGLITSSFRAGVAADGLSSGMMSKFVTLFKFAGVLAGVVLAGVLLGWLGTGGGWGSESRPPEEPSPGPDSVSAKLLLSRRTARLRAALRLVPRASSLSAREAVAVSETLTNWEDKVDQILTSDVPEADKARKMTRAISAPAGKGPGRGCAAPIQPRVRPGLSLPGPVPDQFRLARAGAGRAGGRRAQSAQQLETCPPCSVSPANPQNPKAGEAKDILRLFLEEDYGADWNAWQAKVDQWLEDNPD